MSPQSPWDLYTEEHKARIARAVAAGEARKQPGLQQQPGLQTPAEQGDYLSDYGKDWSTGRKIANYLPIIGGTLDMYDMFNEEVSIGEQFRTHGWITSLRIGGALLDFIPLLGVPGAFARGGIRMASRQAILGGTKSAIKRSERAAARKAAMESGVTDDLGEEILLLADPKRMTAEQHRKALEVLKKRQARAPIARALQDIAETGELQRGQIRLLDKEADKLIEAAKKTTPGPSSPLLSAAEPVSPDRAWGLLGDKYVIGIKEIDANHKWVKSGLIDRHNPANASGDLSELKGYWQKFYQDGKAGKEVGYRATFETPGVAGREGTAVIHRVEDRWQATVMVGAETKILAPTSTLYEAKAALAALATDSEVQQRVLAHTIRKEQGFIPALMSNVGRKITRRARKDIDKLPDTPDNILLKEVAGDDWSIEITDEAVALALSGKNMSAYVRSLERGAKEATDVARLYLADHQVESAEWYLEMSTNPLFVGKNKTFGYSGFSISKKNAWLTKDGSGTLVVQNKKLDEDIYNFMDDPEKYAGVNLEAERIANELSRRFETRFIELKGVSNNPAIQNMSRIDNYITHIQDPALRELLRKHSRSTRVRQGKRGIPDYPYFHFTDRTSARSEGKVSAFDSFKSYEVAAMRSKHMERAGRQVDRLLVEAQNEGDAWAIGQVKAVIMGEGHDVAMRDARAFLGALDQTIGRLPGGQRLIDKTRLQTERDVIRLTARISSNMYRGLLYGRMPTAIDQFTQFINTASDIGAFSTVKGIGQLARMGLAPRSLAYGIQEGIKSPGYTAAGGLAGLGVGLLAGLGPVGLAVAAAVMPIARVSKAAIRHQLPEAIMQPIGIKSVSRTLRGPEFVEASSSLLRHLDEVGFSLLDFAETILRGATFMGGLDGAARMGLRGREALEFAVRVVDKTQFTYDQLSRNPWFRNTMTGNIVAPLSSFPLKQMGFLRRQITEGASDGASPVVAMTRYLFWNGIAAGAIREAAKATIGEELVPRALEERIEPGFLGPTVPFGVKAPPGFATAAAGGLTRTPGVKIFQATYDAMAAKEVTAATFDQFIKTFVPFGLVVSDALRHRSRTADGEIRRGEGVASQLYDPITGSLRWPTRGMARGGVVRRTTTTREFGRLFGLVSPEETRQMDLEREARVMENSYTNSTMNEYFDMIIRNPYTSEEEKRSSLIELGMTEEGMRKLAMGGFRRQDIQALHFTRMQREFTQLPQIYKKLVAVGLSNNKSAREEAQKLAQRMAMPASHYHKWVGILRGLLEQERERAGRRQ